MPPLSTILLHYNDTATTPDLLASYTPLPPLSSSIPICTCDSGNSCFALLLLFTSSFSRVALPPTSFFLSLQKIVSINPLVHKPSKLCGSKPTYSLASLLLADCTSSWSFLRVAWFESGFLPSVSPLAFLEGVVLKGWAAARGLMRVVMLRVGAASARRENVRKLDIFGDVWVGGLEGC